MDIYKDIANRTNGEIYIGVVGPVRTGKSTFIKRFMDMCVIPYMEEGHVKERTIDELPQSSQGKTIMTTEPKFIPQNAVRICLEGKQEVKVRLVDCVGFVVDGASGHMEGNDSRMVKTPWQEEEMPFEEAARIGTLKVIKEHATIGVVIITDGSFGEIQRENYIKAEEDTIAEMERAGKPYIILLNSEKPYSNETQQLQLELEKKFNKTILPVNCKQLQKSDITKMLEGVLLEFPVVQMEFYIPKWTEMLPNEHKVKKELMEQAMAWLDSVDKMKDMDKVVLPEESLCKTTVIKCHPENGVVEFRMDVEDACYYEYLSDLTDMEISSEYQMIAMIKELAEKRKTYDKVENAIDSVTNIGYGVVTPDLMDITMEEPVLIANGGKYGVKIRANSPSIHMIKANIETEIAPIVGNKEQAEDLIAYIKEGELSGEGLWSANIFGKSLGELMEDGIRSKIEKMDEECQQQLQNTMQKIVNDNNGGLVCIII